MKKIRYRPFQPLILHIFLWTFVMVTVACCSGQEKKEAAAKRKTETGQGVLKTAFEEEFLVGTALNRPQIMGRKPEETALVSRQFNTITPENILKWERVHPEPGQYRFSAADRFVAMGKERDMFVVGHTLIWHNQTPDWVFQAGGEGPADRDTLLRRMQQHIQKVAGRYRGKIDGWDVVNEAVTGDGRLRQSSWMQIIGEEYLLKAFQYAAKAAPEAELYYNDYSLNEPAKREGVIRMVKKLRKQGARIDGIGMQAHYGLEYPPLHEIQQSIDAFAQLGLKVMITELDIDVLPDPEGSGGAEITETFRGSEQLDPYAGGLPDSVQQKLSNRYRALFELFRKNSSKISRVTFWGVNDGQSWKNNWPVRGRTNYPLLFDRNNQPKPAYESVLQVGSAH